MFFSLKIKAPCFNRNVSAKTQNKQLYKEEIGMKKSNFYAGVVMSGGDVGT